MRRALLVSIAILLAVMGGPGHAQNLTGTILGTVTDPDGLSVPDVDITATNLGTGLVRRATSGDSGTYTLAALPVGEYEIVASIEGFETVVIPNAVVQIDQQARHDVALTLGQVTTEINVVAGPQLLQTEKSSVGSVIDGLRIDRLPMNGRRFETFVQLFAGAVTPAPGSEIGQRGGFNVGGVDENSNSFFTDGFDNVDPIVRNISHRPILDSIAEFSVEQNSYNPEFGRNAGAVINVTTKSGTNEFHGALWEYHRNDNLDARTVFSRDTKPDLLRNQFGATAGGPIVTDKTFFFAAWESLREKRGVVKRAFVPTVLQRGGNFSELETPIVDPLTGDPFGGSIIPPDRLNPIGLSVLRAFPLPNIPNVAPEQPNRLEIANHIENVDDVSVRIDTGLNDGTTMNARYSYSNARILDPFRDDTPGTSDLKDFGQTNDIIRTNAGFGFTSVISPTIVHEFRAGYNRFKQPQTPLLPLPPEQSGLATLNETFQFFLVQGLSSIGSNRRFDRTVNVYNYIDQLSVVAGNHQMKFGADVRRYLFNAGSYNPNFFVFAGMGQTGPFFSGNAIADLAMGNVLQVIGFEGDAYANPRKTEAALYIQDSWKVSPTFTLNYGLRWEWYGRVTENIDEQSNWSPDCVCIKIAGKDTPSQLVGDDLNNFAPRLGLAWRPFGNDSTVIRAGGGIFYDNEQRHNFFQAANSPFLDTLIYFFTSLDDPFRGPSPDVTPWGIPEDFRDTYAGHWNLGVQTEFLPNTILDVAYVGNRFVKMQRTRNVNQLRSDASRPFDAFQDVLVQEQAAKSAYHSLQVRVEGRPAARLALISAYTWGHALDDRPAQAAASIYGPSGLGIQNSYDLSREWANSDFDVRHRYSLSAVYDLPETGYRGFAGQFLDGWGLNGILLIQSGRPLTVTAFSQTRTLRPDAVEGADPVPSNQGPDHWINPDAFTSPVGFYGTLGRNTVIGPGLSTLDFSIVKSFEMRDSRRLQFRAEFFNAFNHPNFGLPNRTFGVPDFGVISSTTTSPRQIQFGLRYEY
jgi:hypothetical protein